MLNILDEKEIRTSESIENEYKHCKFILTDYSGLENPSGRLCEYLGRELPGDLPDRQSVCEAKYP